MTSLKTHMKNMKDDVKDGMQKVGHTLKNTASDLKHEAKGVMQNLEDKEEDYHRKLKEHVDREVKNDDFRDNSFK